MLRYSPLVIAGFLLTIGTAYACSCTQSTPAERFERADLVFSATVEGADPQTFSSFVDYKLAVKKVWKGDVSGTVTITSHESTTTCGFPFAVGKEYLVYATKNGSAIETNLCSGTAELEYANEDLAYLENRSGQTQCRPYLCADGSIHPRCTDDGHVINYFQDPCQGRGEVPFSDVTITHPQYEAIFYAKAEGYVQGYADGTFKPGNRINRAEFVKVLMKTRFQQQSIDQCLGKTRFPFSDVSVSTWFAPYLCMAGTSNVVSGYPDGSFRAANDIMMAEAAKIIVNTYVIPVQTDPLTLETWWQTYVRTMREQKALPASYKSPEQKVTRGDLAEMLWRLRNYKSE